VKHDPGAGRSLCGKAGLSLDAPYYSLRKARRDRPGGTDLQFGFGDHVLDVDRRELRRGAELIALEPQVFDLLVYLVQNRDRVVSRTTSWRRSGAAGSCRIRL
jgi:hypothetical protein